MKPKKKICLRYENNRNLNVFSFENSYSGMTLYEIYCELWSKENSNALVSS